ncbi:hypothetical protein HanPSC8_Chr12g0503301 [Helianthus annuus]|nr:hypothetical protein HanPSC8_Chr12g0503301 [Helianthus annuus]
MAQLNDDARFLSAGELTARKRQLVTRSCNDTNHSKEKTYVSTSPLFRLTTSSGTRRFSLRGWKDSLVGLGDSV